MQHAVRALMICAVAATMAVVAGCGGGGNDDASKFAPASGASDSPAGDDGGSSGATEPSGSNAAPTSDAAARPSGDVSVSAGAGEAVVEADGDTLTYASSGSIYYTCDVGSDRIQVNYQTASGHDLLIRASYREGAWGGSITFSPGGGENVRYSATLPKDGELVAGDGVLRYTGNTTFTVIGQDLETARDVAATIEVNCGSGGEDATAEIDGQTFTFPASGAQSFDCEVSADAFSVTINRLAVDNLQLSLEARQDAGAGGWLGNVTVISGDDTYTSTLSADGEGLEVSGSTITYSGTFKHNTKTNRSLNEEVDGSAMVTCP